jgi:hypothetical protein
MQVEHVEAIYSKLMEYSLRQGFSQQKCINKLFLSHRKISLRKFHLNWCHFFFGFYLQVNLLMRQRSMME